MSNFLVGSLINDVHQFINLKYSNEEILYYSSYEQEIMCRKNKSFFMITKYSKNLKKTKHKIVNVPPFQYFNLKIKRELINFDYSVIKGNIL
jgi:hypothetical protein